MRTIFMVLLFIRCHASVFFKMLIEQKTSDFYQKWLKLHFLNMSFLGLAPMLHLGNTISRGPPLTMQNCYKFLHVSIRFSIWFCDYDTQHLKIRFGKLFNSHIMWYISISFIIFCIYRIEIKDNYMTLNFRITIRS